MMNIQVINFAKSVAPKIERSLYGSSSGSKTSRITFLGFDEDRYRVAATKTRPLFSCFYKRIQTDDNQSYWVNKNSLKRRFAFHFQFLSQFFPETQAQHENGVEEPLLKEDATLISTEALKHAMEGCSTRQFSDVEVSQILAAAKGLNGGQGPLLVRGKPHHLSRSILISQPDPVTGKRRRFLLMTHVRNGGDKLLGEGGFGKAKYAIDLETGTKYVVKVCRKRGALDWKGFDSEMAAMEKMRGKKGVVQLEYARKFGNKCYFIMENYDQGNLLNALNSRTIPAPLQIAYDVAVGLAALHKTGLSHRDIKSLNVFLKGENLRANLGDLGFAQKKIGTFDGSGTISCFSPGRAAAFYNYFQLGTIAPLNYERDDVWALGLVLYKLFHPQKRPALKETFSEREVSDFLLKRADLQLPLNLNAIKDEKIRSLLDQLLTFENERLSAAQVVSELEKIAEIQGLHLLA